MILHKTKRRLAALYDEAKAKNGGKISAEHVRKILAKIDSKERKVKADLAETSDAAERDKLARKLTIIDEQRSRGEELLELIRRDEHKSTSVLTLLS